MCFMFAYIPLFVCVCLCLCLGAHEHMCIFQKSKNLCVYVCVHIQCACTHVLTGAGGLGLPLCDWDRARRVWVTWANGFMVMAPIS